MGFFAALQMIYNILQTVRQIFDFVQENKNEKWFQDSAATFTKLKEAKTADERKKMAQDLANLLSRT